MNAVLSWGHCAQHGDVLIGALGRCTRCEPTRATVAQPRAPRRPIRRLGRPPAVTDNLGFTPAERQVVDLLALGHRQVEIARQLGKSRTSVTATVARCKIRMECDTELELVRRVRWAMVGRSAP